MQAFFYFPQCLFICCSRFVQIYIESILQLPLKIRSVWHFILLTALTVFSLLIGLLHISFVFTERILFLWMITAPTNLIVYIIGAPRSGTTRLHKLVSSNETEFTAMRMWELFFAPSLIQKKIFAFVGKLDGLLNSVFSKTIQKAEKGLFNKFNNIHALSLFNVEEDALVLFHLCYTYHLSFLLGTEKSYADLNRNKNIPKAVWVYYKYCIENHQIQNPGKVYIAKNPFFTAHTKSLESLFSKVKFINLSRDISEVAPSFYSMKKHLSKVFYGCEPSQKKYDEILDLLNYWQREGIQLDKANSIQLNYLDLKKKPSLMVENIYTFLNLELSDLYKKALLIEDEKSKAFKSKHKY